MSVSWQVSEQKSYSHYLIRKWGANYLTEGSFLAPFTPPAILSLCVARLLWCRLWAIHRSSVDRFETCRLYFS